MELDAPAEYRDLEIRDDSYHSVSMLAGVALVLGLLSPLAFAHVLLWGLPIAGVALSAIAIYRIDRSDGALIGRKAAVAGLAISLFCALAAATQTITRRLWLTHGARQVADRFLELLQAGDTRGAHRLFTGPQFRYPAGVDPETYYSENPEAAKDHDTFVKREIVNDLLSLGDRAEIRHQSTRLSSIDPLNDYLLVYYHLAGPSPGGPIDKDIQLSVIRSLQFRDTETWRVYTIDPVIEGR
jgi:hypothetical protein